MEVGLSGRILQQLGHYSNSNDQSIPQRSCDDDYPQLLQAAKDSLETLPPEQLKVAVEFLRYLEERASDEATEELLKIPGLLDDIAEAERDIAEGRMTNWRELRRKS